MLTVVVVTLVRIDATHFEEPLKFLESGHAPCALDDDKSVKHLIAGPVAFPAPPVRLPDEADGEASFSVYKTNNPAELDQPFLLVVRTRHVVTSVNAPSDGTGSAGYSGFPAYSQMRTALLPARGAAKKCPAGRVSRPEKTCHLRTVIVTAAVYRGLGSRLCPKANLSP